MPGAPAFYRSYFADPARSARALMHDVFVPVGHFRAVADAPELDRLVKDLEFAISRGAFSPAAADAGRDDRPAPSRDDRLPEPRDRRDGGMAGSTRPRAPDGPNPLEDLDKMAAPRAAVGRIRGGAPDAGTPASRRTPRGSKRCTTPYAWGASWAARSGSAPSPCRSPRSVTGPADPAGQGPADHRRRRGTGAGPAAAPAGRSGGGEGLPTAEPQVLPVKRPPPLKHPFQ